MFSGLSVILAALSLIVTIVGWIVTYKKQKEILERQIAAEVEKEKLSRYLSINLTELERARNWVETGFKIFRRIEKNISINDKEEILGLVKEWEIEGGEILHLSYYLEKKSKTTKLKGNFDHLEHYLSTFFRGVLNEYSRIVLGEDLTPTDFEIDSGYYALDRIDALIRENLGQPIPKKY